METFVNMTVESTIERGIVVIRVTGPIEIRTARELASAANSFLGAGHRKILIDMGQVAYVDAVGGGILIEIRAEAARRGGKVILASLPRIIGRVFRLCGMDSLFAIYETTEEAIFAFASVDRSVTSQVVET